MLPTHNSRTAKPPSLTTTACRSYHISTDTPETALGGRMFRSAAAGSKSDLLHRRAEQQRIREIPEAQVESDEEIVEVGKVPNAEVPEDGDNPSELDGDPIAGDLPVSIFQKTIEYVY